VGRLQLEVVMRITLQQRLEFGPRRTNSRQRVRAVTLKHSLSDGANSKQSLHSPPLRPNGSVLRLKAARLHRKTSRRQSTNHAAWNYSAWEKWLLIWSSRSEAGTKACGMNCSSTKGLKRSNSNSSSDPMPAHLMPLLFGHGPTSHHEVSVALQI